MVKVAKNIFDLNAYNNLVKDVRKANQRIQKIQARYGENSWAITDLYNKLDNKQINAISTLSGSIKINKAMSDIQLKAIEKAVKNFLSPETKTSTLRGIKKVIKTTKISLQQTLSDRNNIISESDIEKLYKLVEDKTYRDMTEKMNASTVWARLVQAKEQNKTENQFINLFKNSSDIKDSSVREYLSEIYNKYMNP